MSKNNLEKFLEKNPGRTPFVVRTKDGDVCYALSKFSKNRGDIRCEFIKDTEIKSVNQLMILTREESYQLAGQIRRFMVNNPSVAYPNAYRVLFDYVKFPQLENEVFEEEKKVQVTNKKIRANVVSVDVNPQKRAVTILSGNGDFVSVKKDKMGVFNEYEIKQGLLIALLKLHNKELLVELYKFPPLFDAETLPDTLLGLVYSLVYKDFKDFQHFFKWLDYMIKKATITKKGDEKDAK